MPETLDTKPSINHQELLAAHEVSKRDRDGINDELRRVYKYLLPTFSCTSHEDYSFLQDNTVASVLNRMSKRAWVLATVDNMVNFRLSLGRDFNDVEKMSKEQILLEEAGDKISSFLGRTNLNVEGPRHVLQMAVTGTSLMIGKRIPELRNEFRFFVKDRRRFCVLPGLRNEQKKVYTNLMHRPVIWDEKMTAEQIKTEFDLDVEENPEGYDINNMYFSIYEETGTGEDKVLSHKSFRYVFSPTISKAADVKYIHYSELDEPMMVILSNYYDREDSVYGMGRGEEFLSTAKFLDDLASKSIQVAENQAEPLVMYPEGSVKNQGTEQDQGDVITYNSKDGRAPIPLHSDNAGPLLTVLHNAQAKVKEQEGTDLPGQSELARFVSPTEWSDRRSTANQLLGQETQIYTQNVLKPIAGQALAVLQMEKKIESYLDSEKKLPINLIDGDSIDIQWDNALERIKAGNEVDRMNQWNAYIQGGLLTRQISELDVKVGVNAPHFLAFGAKRMGVRETIWNSPKEQDAELKRQEDRAQRVAQEAGVGQVPAPTQPSAAPQPVV